MTFDELLALVSSGDSLRIRMDSRLVEDGDIFAAVGGIVYDLSLIHISEPTRPY